MAGGPSWGKLSAMANAPRSRDGRPPWVQVLASRMTPAIKVLVIAYAAIYLLYVFVRQVRPLVEEHLTVGPRMLHEPWQPVTAMLVHVDFLTILFGLIGLWFVGEYIERTLGTRRFLVLFFGAGILANVATGLLVPRLGVRDVYCGMAPAVLALFVAFGRIYGRNPTQILGNLYLKATHAAILFVGWAVVANLLARDVPGLAGTIVVTLVGYLLGSRGGLREAYDTFRARRLRQRYKVLDGGVPTRAKGGRSQKYWN
jgi:membrane associated rhomboid family serine protease